MTFKKEEKEGISPTLIKVSWKISQFLIFSLVSDMFCDAVFWGSSVALKGINRINRLTLIPKLPVHTVHSFRIIVNL